MTTVPLSIINLRVNQETANAADQVYLNKNPDFQREYEAWDDKLKTRFIETVLIGRAMNPIWTIVNEEEESEEVLDGMHRLTTAIDYINNKFPINENYLSDESMRDKYQKKYFKDLSLDDKQKIRNYNFVINQLDSSYRKDPNKLRDQYEILNRSSKTLNDYEFNKVMYNSYYDIISKYKDSLKDKFFRGVDKRGNIQTEIIDIIALANDLPSSWSSVASLRETYLENTIGNSQSSVEEYIAKHKDDIESQLKMMKKIIFTLDDNRFFSNEKRTFKKYFVPYKFIVSRLLYKFKTDISSFNRHYIDILKEFRSQITEVPDKTLQEIFNCGSSGRNATFQRKLLTKIDIIIYMSCCKTEDKRLFLETDKEKKLIEQGNKCAYCRVSKRIYEGDHIIPWSEGGRTDYPNLQMLCKDCHRMKTTQQNKMCNG